MGLVTRTALLAVGLNEYNLWVPATHMRVRITRFCLDVTNDASASPPGVANFYLLADNQQVITLATVYLPATAGTAFGAYSTRWVDLGEGVTTDLIGETVQLLTSRALASGQVYLTVCGYEEVGPARVPTLHEVIPRLLSIAGDEQVLVTGLYLDEGGTPAVKVDGIAAAVDYASFGQLSFGSLPHSAAPAIGVYDADVTVTNNAGESESRGLFYYDPATLPTITSLSHTSLAEGATTTVTATGTGFTTYGGINRVGFFADRPPTGRPPLHAGSLAHFSAAAAVTATSFTFTIGALPDGVWYVVPGYNADWLGTSQIQLTITEV